MNKADNELLTRVGPGTPMGDLLRRFWMPALIESELAEPDGPPMRLRLLGEDLIAFRDTEGRIGILGANCPHRQAGLYFGRNEDNGLRCVYHGWKFDTTGACVDMPSEPRGEQMKQHIRATAYPCFARGGVIWVYMGPPELSPEPPDLEWMRVPAEQAATTKRLQECNWAQAVEGGIDSSHISFLHRDDTVLMNAGHLALSEQTNPVFDVKQTNGGLLIGARRMARDGRHLWRVHQYLVPFYQMIPATLKDTEDSSDLYYSGHVWVPIDDENTWTWTFACNPHRAMTADEKARYGRNHLYRGMLDDHYYPLSHRGNDYGLDRRLQKTTSFTGIPGLANQDAAIQESMGRIVDRTKEHLGTSDAGPAAFRRLILNLVRDLQNGKEPDAARNGAWYNVRSASFLLAPGVPFEKGGAHLFSTSEIEKSTG